MKKIFTLLLLFIIVLSPAIGQISQGGLPYALRNGLSKNNLTVKKLPALNMAAIQQEDDQSYRSRFGKIIPVKLNLKNSGNWQTLTDGSRLWQLAINSKDAKALSLYYNDFYLPDGSQLFVYSEDGEEVLGAFTAINNKVSNTFATGIIRSETIILEYHEPKNVKQQARIQISGVGHAYRLIDDRNRKDFGDADACQININCTEGDNWQNEKDAVARILVTDNGSQYWCSGALINNARQDCTPYFLTAEHCGQTSTTNDFTQWIFYFNYQAPNCTNPASEGTLASQSLTGATLKAQSNDNGGDSGSDMMLLELSATIPAAYGVYFAGWNNANTASSSGVGIHHPDGDIKKISTYTSTVSSGSFGGITANTHWKFTWASGVTETGSSGSPLFDNNHRIVGTLTGGTSFCNTQTGIDEYGKFSYHWTSNGTTANRQLKGWLDPDNTGITTLDGVYAPCNVSTNTFNTKTNIKVFPNPVTDQLTIDMQDVTTNNRLEFKLFNALGILVFDEKMNEKETLQTINVSNYAKGIYFLTIQADEQVFSKRVLIQ